MAHVAFFVLLPLLLLLITLTARLLWPRSKQLQTLSRIPSPPALPIVGHLHLVGSLPHVSLRDLAAKHAGGGGLMLLRLGAVPTVIVSSARAAEAVLRTHDRVFASRPYNPLAADDVMCRAVSGSFFFEGGRNRIIPDLTAVVKDVFGAFKLQDYFPAMARVDVLSRSSLAKAMALRERWDELFDTLIDFHVQRLPQKRRRMEEEEESVDGSDFIDVMLSLTDEYGLTRDHIKAILMVEHVQRRHGHDVPGARVRHGRAHATPARNADCEVEGYMIPAGTTVMINAWGIGRDPRFWEDPEEFKPERFLEGGHAVEVEYRGQDFNYIPFGSGRRICPGMNFGIASLEIMLANLLYHFDWEVPGGKGKDGIDMTEKFGVTVHRKEKLMLIPKIKR
ncbi:unnamed protein product [Urochloa decumbens]|uniref:Uncharacterized protein n=1 Tax=Urochloa decumbens TaxID=240449 RepID=A0ABC9BW97_9POAL